MSANADEQLRGLLATLCGYPIGTRDYVAFFVNEFGEGLVFVREPKKRHAVFLHSDLGWEPKLIQGPPRPGAEGLDVPANVRQFLGDIPVVGEVILDRSEALWLEACLAASERW